MKQLSDFKENIHSCSKCGLCQSVCPIYKITGNDCTVSRGHFIMLQGLIKGELKMSKTINKYLNLCLKCGACSRFCPSGIDVVDIIATAKAEYYKLHKFVQFKSFFLNLSIKVLNIINKIFKNNRSKKFEKKVIYFGGCGGINNNVIKILNSINIEVITPTFNCCGFPFFINGDMKTFKKYMDKFYNIIDKYDNYEILTNCSTCEKTLKSYKKWGGKDLNIKNVFDYIRDNNLKFELKKPQKVTFHKPCNMDNYKDVKYILENTNNLEYAVMKNFDKCCGFEGLFNLQELKIMSKIFKEKHNNILESGANIVLTSCIACKIALSMFSCGKYRVQDMADFLAKNLK